MFILDQAIIQNDATVLNARNAELISNKDWTITDGGTDDDFVLPEIAGNSLASDNSTISITFNENIYWTDVGSNQSSFLKVPQQ